MAVALPSERDVYANLLRDSRGLRRDQASARDTWFASLPWEKKEQTLFELEMLLKGIACFGNPRNHAGPTRSSESMGHDYAEELRVLRDGVGQAGALVRSLLGDRERAYTFSRYLSSVLPEDSSRGQLLQEQLTQDTPEEALFVLRNAFASYHDLIDGLLRLDHVPHKLYVAAHGSLTREVGRNVFFNPLMALEFRPEFDRIRNAEVLETLQLVDAESAHRVVALAMLSLFRALRYLDLIDQYAPDPSAARRSHLILAVLRSDLRALTRYLGRHAADVIANGLERRIVAVHMVEIRERTDEIAREANALSTLRNGLETVASSVRVDVRKVFSVDLPSPSDAPTGAELGPQLVVATATLRASLHHAITSLCRIIARGRPPPRLAQDAAAQNAEGERLRREIWMFMQILRAFIAKAKVADPGSDRWAGAASFQFVRDFLAHFRAIGYQLVRANDYERLDPFLSALEQLRDVDLVEPERLLFAVDECQRFYGFLEELFSEVSHRKGLEEVAFDRQDAVATLKVYLGR
ncbi:MAG: hypothetical protein AB7S26_22285 [Sandaracinaceae bacterium]